MEKETKLVGMKKMAKGLNSNCDSGWEKVKWPKKANTLLCRFEEDSGLIVGHNINGWSTIKREKSGWYLSIRENDVSLEPLKERVLYFFDCNYMVTDPCSVARKLMKLVSKEERRKANENKRLSSDQAGH